MTPEQLNELERLRMEVLEPKTPMPARFRELSYRCALFKAAPELIAMARQSLTRSLQEHGKPLSVEPSADREVNPGLGLPQEKARSEAETPLGCVEAMLPESRAGLPPTEGPKAEGLTEQGGTACECQARKALEEVDATLCECRYSPEYASVRECNCDVHAAHRIIRAALSAPCPCEQEIAELRKDRELVVREMRRRTLADGERINELTDWIKAANQFMWAHEHTCPRHNTDAACNCGLDRFLGTPRPVIESFRAENAALREQLAEERARLDAMIKHSWRVVDLPSHKDGRWHVWKTGSTGVHVATADDPRAAIDAGRAGKGEQDAE